MMFWGQHLELSSLVSFAAVSLSSFGDLIVY